VRYPDGESLLLVRPLGPARARDTAVDGLAGKLVTKPVVTRDQVMLAVQQLYVSDGERMYVVAVLDRSALPADVELTFLAGLPYATAEGERQRKIVAVTEPDGVPFDLGEPDEVLDTQGILLAGGLALSASGSLRVVNPPAGPAYVNSPQTIGLTQEQVAFALGDDPRGYGNPDHGWQRVVRTNQVLAGPIPETPHGRAVFALCYGPEPDPISVTAEATEEGVLVYAPGFAALIGHPAGDEHGDPILRLSAR
jgi:hypothetical protein